MARAFSDKEKELIKEKLLKGALEYMQRFGVRKTTVDELATSAGISKGAFYLFYESKENLFYEAFMLLHDQVQEGALKMIDEFNGELTVDAIVELAMLGMEKVKPWKSFLASGELEAMLEKLPEENSEHIEQDNDFFNQLLIMVKDRVALKDNIDTKVVTACFRAIMLTMLYTKVIGEDVYEDMARVLFRGVAMQFIKQ